MQNSVLLGQTKNVLEGRVYDEETLESLPGANIVWLQNTQKGTITNNFGEFILEGIPEGFQAFEVSYIGYYKHIIKIYISDGKTRYDVPLKLQIRELVPIVIDAPAPILDRYLTGTATKIPVSTLEFLKAIGTQEALEFTVPGITGTSDDGFGNSRINIGIRGLNPNRSSRALILEDGIPIQPAVYLFSDVFYNPPIERIESIEVIKSNAAIKYGPHTMGGIVNYLTKKPSENFAGKLQLMGGNNAFVNSFLEIEGFGNEKFTPMFQALYKRGNGFRENNNFEQFNFTFKGLIIPNKKRIIEIKLNSNLENSNATYTGLTEFALENNARFNPKKFDHFQLKRFGLAVTQNLVQSKNLNATTQFYFNTIDKKWWREYDVFVQANEFEKGNIIPLTIPQTQQVSDLLRVGNGKNNFGILRTFYTLGLQQTYQFKHQIKKQNATLEIGIRGHFERFLDVLEQGQSPDARAGILFFTDSLGNFQRIGRSQNYETYAGSIYLFENLNWKEKWIFTPGFRLEFFEQEMVDKLYGNELKDQSTFVFLPGFGFNYKGKIINVFGGIHRGFTPPSTATLLLLNFGQNGNTPFEAIKLKAETSTNFEIGIRTDNKYFAFETTFFYMRIKNMIAASRGIGFTNLDFVRSQGWENNLLFRANELQDFLPTFHLVYTFLNTKINQGILSQSLLNPQLQANVSGNELPYAPRHNLVLGLSYQINNLGIRFDFQHLSSAFSDFENIDFTTFRGDIGPIKAYKILNTTLIYEIKHRWKFVLSGKNLLDEIYIGSRLLSNPNSNFASSSTGILPGGRRQINFGFQYKF